MDRGYVLHSYPYRETSLILQVWTERHGRLGLVAKGARRPKSASRGLLVAFQPLVLSWFGRGELKTLKSAEPAIAALPLGGASLFPAFYLNELLLKLTLTGLETGRFEDPTTVAQSQQLMRLLINHSLNGQELATRALVRDLQRLEEASPKEEGT